MREVKWPMSSEDYDVTAEDFSFGILRHRSMLYNSVAFTYGHYKIGSGFATIGGTRIGDKLYYGVTFCSPEDNFSKKSGRRYSRRNLTRHEYSHMRGIFSLGSAIDQQPALVLKEAVEAHLVKMRGLRPQWSKGAAVEFRGKRRTVGEVTTYDLMTE